MKHIFLSIMMLTGIGFSFAGNGNGDTDPPCNCAIPNQVNIYATGIAEIIGGNTVKCTGETGTCWEVVFNSGGGWTLTIYTDPIITFGNNNSQDDPPGAPVVVEQGTGYQIYEWDPQVWRER